MTDDKMLGYISHKISVKQHEYDKQLSYFFDFVRVENKTANFESNAINVLLTMQKLKTEIKQLEELWEMYQI